MFRWQGDRYTLNQQVVNFETTLGQLRSMLSPENLTQLLSNSIVVMVFGSNDYINNYLMPNLYASSRTYTPEAFANLLLNHYSRQLQVFPFPFNCLKIKLRIQANSYECFYMMFYRLYTV